MDARDYRRRRPSVGADRTKESDEMVPHAEVNQTALSPEQQGRGDPSGMSRADAVETPRLRAQGVQHSASPGAMERGLVASPFHSELVQSEVALHLSRPSALDAEALTLAGQREARDRDYEGIRVARVERSVDSSEQLASSGRPQVLGPSGHLAGMETPEPAAAVGELALVRQWSHWVRRSGHCPSGATAEQ